MQVFRLMAMPDKVIAFDSLPEKLLKGFELCAADGFPRHWKDWMGKQKRVIPIPPEKDVMTGQVRRFDPIIEEDSFFYLVDWTLGPIVDKWKEICDYARQNVPKDFRLMDKIEDMAKPLAPNKTDGVTLEPEEVTVIPLPGEVSVDKTPTDPAVISKCDEPDCKYESEGVYAKNSIRMHKMKKHPKVLEKV